MRVNEKISISVVIPVRGKLNLLPRALNSCVVQTLTPDEIILIDDETNEENKKEIERIATYFKRLLTYAKIPSTLVLMESKKGGGGVSAARNLGIKRAKGNFIAFLDADDYFLPDKLETQVSSMNREGNDISHTNYIIKSQLHGISKIMNTGFNQGYRQDSVITYRDCSIATPTVMFKKSLLKNENEIFPESVDHGEDLIAWAYLCHLSSKPLLHLDQALTVVEVNEKSNSASTIKIISAKAELEKYAQLRNFATLKFHEYGGLKTSIIQFLPFSNKTIAYILNVIRALKGR